MSSVVTMSLSWCSLIIVKQHRIICLELKYCYWGLASCRKCLSVRWNQLKDPINVTAQNLCQTDAVNGGALEDLQGLCTALCRQRVTISQVPAPKNIQEKMGGSRRGQSVLWGKLDFLQKMPISQTVFQSLKKDYIWLKRNY